MLKEHILPHLLKMDDNALLICSAEDLKALHFPYPYFSSYLTGDALEIERRQHIFRDLIQITMLTDLLEETVLMLENLSETLELENVVELDEAAHITINLVNRPITEAEVSV